MAFLARPLPVGSGTSSLTGEGYLSSVIAVAVRRTLNRLGLSPASTERSTRCPAAGRRVA